MDDKAPPLDLQSGDIWPSSTIKVEGIVLTRFGGD